MNFYEYDSYYTNPYSVNNDVVEEGSWIQVTMSKNEVKDFKSHWPASGLPNRKIIFTFQRDGDLVDIYPSDVDGYAAAVLADEAWLKWIES